MQDADDGHGIVGGLVVDRIGMVEDHAKPGGEVEPRRGGERILPDRLEGSLDCSKKARSDRLRRLARDLEPDVSEVGFGGGGEAEG